MARASRLPWMVALLGVTLALVAADAAADAPARGSAHTPPGNVIRVRGVSGDTVLTLLESPGGGLVRADVLARLLGGSLDSTGRGRWRLTLYSTTVDLAEGSPFAGFNGFALPLTEPTRAVDGRPHVSLQLFSEIIPRFGIGILWDKARWEVRLFQAIARRAGPPAMTDVPGTVIVTRNDEPPAAIPVRTDPASRVETPERAATPARPATTTRAPGAPPGLSRRYKVVVDAGHGGVDPGNPGVVVRGRRVGEAELTLGISLKVERALKARGIDVYMTRRTDTLIARDDRGKLANEQQADLFLSIHTNAANPRWKNGSAVRGFETYFLSAARTEDEARVAAMENDVVRFESTVEAEKGDPLAFIMADIAQNEHLRESSDLATTIQQGLARSHPGPSRGVKQAGFAVLARSYMPAVLIELGFGSNLQDATWMASNAGQQAAAEAIATATLEYLQHYERRTGQTPR
jgi:N-acetylmuramoyl-L-alanine amidase